MDRFYRFPTPSAGGALAEAMAGFAIVTLFAAVGSLVWLDRLPFLNELRGKEAGLPLKSLAAGCAMFCGLLGLLLAVRGLHSLTLTVARRGGLLPIERSVGPFLLAGQPGGAWALALDVDGPALEFALDEATAAELSRIFDPDEVLLAEWIDLPEDEGGPALLSLAPAEEDASQVRRAA
ncbi:MAG: hypothetical protein IT349_15005 [Candidatus Eisenbacteria bacterium]|nr:hypothetical protein [Candidatus Eisenbacteria bacterium]MCC7143404.1 hypothetical protein [Candidatus Eisenbacteria bacterium]